MPFFGGKKNEKKEKSDSVASYPKQQVPPPPSHLAHPMNPHHQQGMIVQHHQDQQFVYQPSVPLMNSSTVVHVSVQRNDLVQQPGFFERLFDGPDFSNRVPDPRVPPAPGSFLVYSNGAPPLGPPPVHSFQHPGQSSSNYPSAPPPSTSMPPPPTYDDVLSQEIKKKL